MNFRPIEAFKGNSCYYNSTVRKYYFQNFNMSKLVKIYYDFISQPSRALWIGLKMSKTPFEDCPVALRKSKLLNT